MKYIALLSLFTCVLAAPASRPAQPSLNCTEIQSQLQAGIQANLDIQAQELSGVQSLQSPSPTSSFESTQQSVLSIQQRGIEIRANNQKLAEQIKSPAIAGLAIVAGAQTKEMMQVMSLTGTSADAGTLGDLVQEVRDGTKQNEENLAAAKGQVCGT